MLTVGQLAAQAGVTAHTVRYYERAGLLPRAKRTASGYRLFPEGALHRIRLVQNASQFGFSLKEIAGFLKVRDAGGAPCREVRIGAARLLEDVNRRVAGLIELRDRMCRVLDEWDSLLERTPAGSPAYLLATLESSNAGRPNDRRKKSLDPGLHSKV